MNFVETHSFCGVSTKFPHQGIKWTGAIILFIIIYFKEILYLGWNEHHLSANFGTIMKSYWFLLQAVSLCDTNLVIKYVELW